MLRFALAPDGAVAPDIRRKLPGRGVWTSLSAEAVRRAVARGGFARGFPRQGRRRAPISRTRSTRCSSATRCSRWRWPTRPDSWSPAPSRSTRRSKTARAALIQASDGAADGAAKREQALRARLGDAGAHVARINLFSSAQLGLALGKANVIHAAVKSGAAASAFLARAERLRRFRASAADANVPSGGGDAPAELRRGSLATEELAEKPTN